MKTTLTTSPNTSISHQPLVGNHSNNGGTFGSFGTTFGQRKRKRSWNYNNAPEETIFARIVVASRMGQTVVATPTCSINAHWLRQCDGTNNHEPSANAANGSRDMEDGTTTRRQPAPSVPNWTRHVPMNHPSKRTTCCSSRYIGWRRRCKTSNLYPSRPPWRMHIWFLLLISHCSLCMDGLVRVAAESNTNYRTEKEEATTRPQPLSTNKAPLAMHNNHNNHPTVEEQWKRASGPSIVLPTRPTPLRTNTIHHNNPPPSQAAGNRMKQQPPSSSSSTATTTRQTATTTTTTAEEELPPTASIVVGTTNSSSSKNDSFSDDGSTTNTILQQGEGTESPPNTIDPPYSSVTTSTDPQPPPQDPLPPSSPSEISPKTTQENSSTVGVADRVSSSIEGGDTIQQAENRNNNNDQETAKRRKLEEEKKRQERYTLFWTWCRQVLGIETLLEIQTFEYLDYMKALPDEDWHDDVDAVVANVEQFPKVPVRGLAASRNITSGEVVIRIPLHALLSVATTIDQDPVLSTVMGPEARRHHGWTIQPLDPQMEVNHPNEGGDETEGQGSDSSSSSSLFWVELPLLALALLHHLRLGAASPMRPYLDILQEQPTDRFPFLWTEEQLRSQVSEGIRTVARGVQRELVDMYETIAVPLISSNPDVFGAPSNDNKDDDDAPFSFAKFQWAFAIVNTRHWQLPIEDLEHSMANSPMYGDQLPPASTPTDEWTVQRQDEQYELDERNPTNHQEEKNDRRSASNDNNSNNNNKATHEPTAPVAPFRHSFLAPVADLLNFGPPCTKGHYNRALHSFEIVASCDLEKGQEVTFWYSDECDHVMVAVYGFMHPMVPACPSAEEYRLAAQEWEERASHLQHKLDRAHDQLETLESTVQQLRAVLRDCGEACCRQYDTWDDDIYEFLFHPEEEEEENDDTPTHTVRGGGGGGGANGGGSSSTSNKNERGGSNHFRAGSASRPTEETDRPHVKIVHKPVEHGGGTRRRHQRPQRRRFRTALSGEPEEHEDL